MTDWLSDYSLMLSAMFLLRKMPAGEGWTTVSRLKDYVDYSIATVYRKIKHLEANGLVETQEFECRKVNCKRYRITDKGIEFLSNFKVLL